MTVEMARLNDERAVLVYANGELDTVSFLTVEERGITALYVLRNPSKLTGITGEVTTVVD
jgi:RNA polymerase sigma-70 factor (ECF subfamily)